MPREVWLVSNLPPPVHGVAMFNAALLERFSTWGVTYRAFPIGTHGALSDVGGFALRKMIDDAKTLSELGKLGISRDTADRNAVIYFTASQGGAATFRDLALVALGRSLGIPLVAHIHGCAWLDVWQRGGMQARIMSGALRACERVICLGPSYAARMTHATGVECVGINNGVPDPGVRVAKTPPRPEESIRLLYLSNLIKSKGLWTAAMALRALLGRGLDVRLECAGAWQSAAEEREFATVFDVELRAGSLVLSGLADERRKRQLFDAAHFFLLPTRYPLEGQPLALVEAMACGTVPITTTQGGIPDLLGFPGWERLANSGHCDATRVADTIEHLIGQPLEFAALSERCLMRYREALTMDACVRDVMRVLQVAPATS